MAELVIFFYSIAFPAKSVTILMGISQINIWKAGNHMDKLDIKLWTLEAKGHIVPDRSLLKTPQQIEAIKKSAALNTAVHDHVAAHIKAGMSTAEIDKLVYDFTKEHGGIPAPLGYEGFPKSVCTSLPFGVT